MVVEILLQELHHIFNTHCRLDSVKFFLEDFILVRLLESQYFFAIFKSFCYLHRKEFSRRSWPSFLRLNKKPLFWAQNSLRLCHLLLHFLLHHFHLFLLLFWGVLHLFCKVLFISCLYFLSFLSAYCSELSCWFSKKCTQFTFIRK